MSSVRKINPSQNGAKVEDLRILDNLHAIAEDLENRCSKTQELGMNGWSELHKATLDQNEISVDQLLASGANVNAATGTGFTAAHIIAYNPEASISKASIAGKIFAKSAMGGDKYGINPFHISPFSNDLEVVQSANTNFKEKCSHWSSRPGEKNGYHILHFAAYVGNAEIMEYLCSSDNCRSLMKTGNNNGLLASHVAAARGDVDSINIMLDADQDSFSQGNGHWWRAANVAAYYGNINAFNVIESKVSWDGNIDNTRSLSVAIQANKYDGNLDFVKSHAKTHPDQIKATDNNGNNALSHAVYGEHTEIVKYFLNEGFVDSQEIRDADDVPASIMGLLANGDH